MIDALPSGIVHGNVASFISNSDLKSLHETCSKIRDETVNSAQMTANDKMIFMYWRKLEEMSNDLSNVRQRFHESKCTQKRVKYHPNDKKADMYYHKVVYGPYFGVTEKHGSWLYYYLDEIAMKVGSDISVYKNMDIKTDRYQLDSTSPTITNKDITTFRLLLINQIDLCDEIAALCDKHRIACKEINRLKTSIQKTMQKYLHVPSFIGSN